MKSTIMILGGFLTALLVETCLLLWLRPESASERLLLAALTILVCIPPGALVAGLVTYWEYSTRSKDSDKPTTKEKL